MRVFIFKQIFNLCIFLILCMISGCTPLIIASGIGCAAGVYKVATDQRTTGTQLDDATISARVKTALIGDSLVSANSVDVDTLDGIVFLTGVVGSKEESDRAVAVSKNIINVKNVKNKLSIGKKTSGQVVDDYFTAAKIKSKLLIEPGIRFLNIDVDVNMGIVSLNGIVNTRAEKELIYSIASSTAGTVDIIDSIIIQNNINE